MSAFSIVTVPISTATVQSTILRTTYVTLTGTSGVATTSQSFQSTFSTTSAKSTSNPTTLPAPVTTSSSLVSMSNLTGITTTSISSSTVLPRTTSLASLPVVATLSTQASLATGSTTLTLQTNQPATTPTQTAAPAVRSVSKHAVIGGLSGAIAGLFMVGAIIFFCLRRRQRRRDDETVVDTEADEKALRPTLLRKWTGFMAQGTPKQTPQMSVNRSPVTVDEEHHIIRMSTQHWARPYAQGTGEGYRESMPIGALRVVNPDRSRPQTPAASTDSPRGFLVKQKSALATVLLNAGGNRSRANSRSGNPTYVPEITVDPALSRECIAPTAMPPSFKSYPSVTSLAIVQQQPPEDPFVTPPEKTEDETPRPTPKRPGLAPIQSAASLAQRTLSHVLHPFRSKSNMSMNQSNRSSISSFMTRERNRDTRYSDPFDLDRPSVRTVPSAHLRSTSGYEQRWTMTQPRYEGT